jgi:PiT family inorganic phosphate transporter
MGSGLTEVKPAQGFSAETSTAAAILASSHLGFALSTTQVASGSVIGSGLGRKGAEVRWGTAGRIALGWLFTLPAAGVVGGLAAALAHLGTAGLIAVTVLGAGSLLVIWWLSRRELVGHHNAISDVDGAGLAVAIPSKKERRKAARAKKKALEAQQAAAAGTQPEPAAEQAAEAAAEQAPGQPAGPPPVQVTQEPAARAAGETNETEENAR